MRLVLFFPDVTVDLIQAAESAVTLNLNSSGGGTKMSRCLYFKVLMAAVIWGVLQVAAVQAKSPPVYLNLSDKSVKTEGENYWTGGAESLSLADPAVSTASCELGCDASCPGCDACGFVEGTCHKKKCCDPWAHHAVYGGFLYTRPRDADVSYGVPINGPITAPPANNPLQVGSVGTVDPDFEPAFYAGFRFCCSPCSNIDVRYTLFESSTEDAISTDVPNVIRSMVAHPSSTSAATDFLSASAQLEINFDLLDAVYRRRVSQGPCHALYYVAGARYAKLDQRFSSVFVNNGVETVNTDIDFDGAGARLGLEAERFSCHSCWSVFARGYANFLAGRFRGDYLQSQAFDPIVVQTDWEAGRVVSILDLELGVAWTSPNNCWRIASSYNFSSWFNAVKTEEFINAVQQNDFDHLDDQVTFDGLAAHVEYRF